MTTSLGFFLLLGY